MLALLASELILEPSDIPLDFADSLSLEAAILNNETNAQIHKFIQLITSLLCQISS